MDTTKDFSVRLHAMPDDTAVAVRANRRERVDRALEAIEGVMFSANDNFKRFVIFVLTNFACTHIHSFARGAFSGGVQFSPKPKFSREAAGVIDAGYRSPILFPTQWRATAGGFAAGVAKLGATSGVFLLPILKEKSGVPSVLGMVSAACLLGLFVTLASGAKTQSSDSSE